MSTYSPEELLERWTREDVSVEQVVGQVIQLLNQIERRLREIERRLPETPPVKGERRT